jgi:hypothetical protein
MHLPLNLQKSFHPERRPRLAILVDLEARQLLFPLTAKKKRLFRSMTKIKRKRRKRNTQERRHRKFPNSKSPFPHY